MIKRVIVPASSNLCGQACLAMLTGHTLDTVCALLPTREGTYISQLQAYLALHGWKFDTRLRRTRAGRAQSDLAIIRIIWSHRGLGHWAVWADGRVLDPAERLASGWRASSYLALARPV